MDRRWSFLEFDSLATSRGTGPREGRSSTTRWWDSVWSSQDNSLLCEFRDSASEWIVFVRIFVSGHGPVVGEVRVYPEHKADPKARPMGEWSRRANDIPPNGVTATFLRDVPLHTLLQRAMDERFPQLQEIALGGVLTNLQKHGPFGRSDRSGRPSSRVQHPGHRGQGDLPFAETAELYVQACSRKVRNPVQAVADKLNLDRDTVRDRLAEARRREILSRPPKKGVAGGILLPKGIKVLEEHRKRTTGKTNRKGGR